MREKVERNFFIKRIRQPGSWLLMIVLTAIAWKLILLSWNAFPFNSDEAIVALMARHILQGERPIFFYGQAYMGSLDAYLVAMGFMVLGQKIWVIRALQSLLYVATIVITYFIGKRAFHSTKIGLIAALLLAIPTVNTTLYTTISLGGYGEALLIGSLLVYLAFRLQTDIESDVFHILPVFFFVFLSALGLWVHGISLVFSVPCFVYVFYVVIKQKTLRKVWKKVMMTAIPGILLGLLPLIIFGVQHGFQTIWSELFGSAVSVEQMPWLERAGTHLISLVLFGLPLMIGIRPPWTATLQQVWLIPVVILFTILVGFVLYRDWRSKRLPGSAHLLLGIIGLLFLAFIVTSFGVDPSGRYFLPIVIPGALLCAYASENFLQRWRYFAILLVMVCGYLILVTCTLALHWPHLTTQFYTPAMVNHEYDQELITFLEQEDLPCGYSNYWVAYPLAFRTQEKIIYIPALPYHTDLSYTQRDDRYAPYDDFVANCRAPSYITTNNAALDAVLQAYFVENQVAYQYREIGDYHIYYHLSEDVRPDAFEFYRTSTGRFHAE